MQGYKIFGKNYTCRGYKYQLDATNVFTGTMGNRGFHFCAKPEDCLRYYKLNENNTYAVVQSGEIYKKAVIKLCVKN